MRTRDRWLGMDRPIARRDFLNGVAVAAGATAAGMLAAVGAEGKADAGTAASAAPQRPYPPRLTGLRGSHPGSFEIAHQLRDGDVHVPVPGAVEGYDLVIVGGGISGL